jgi:energy-coupling factor transport system ATP-binding protein
VIEFQKVSFGYNGGRTLSDISFRLEKGEFAAVVGENGAGKTTISKLCNGLLKPAQGTVTVNGMDTKQTRTSRIARSVGFLFQNPDRQICRNNVREEILFGLTLTVDDPAERSRRVEATLADFGFDPDRNPFAMSRGERQRLALASLMACEPDVMILDEPTTGLDYRECMEIMEKIAARNGRARRTSCLHDIEIVQDFARRVLVVGRGAIGTVDRRNHDGRALLNARSVARRKSPAAQGRVSSRRLHHHRWRTPLKGGCADGRLPSLRAGRFPPAPQNPLTKILFSIALCARACQRKSLFVWQFLW